MQIKNILKYFKGITKLPEDDIKAKISAEIQKSSATSIYLNSIHQAGDAVLFIAKDKKEKALIVVSEKKKGVIANFAGTAVEDCGVYGKKCELNAENAELLRKFFPWTAPSSLRKKKTTIGCGDRLGRATPGHIAAIRKFEVSPVFAQQSMRELSLTGRTYRNVIDDATFLVFQEDFTEDFGADGDHLKKLEDITSAIETGITMITLDLSENLRLNFANASQGEIDSAFGKLPSVTKDRIKDIYFGRAVCAGSLTFNISENEAKRAALIYLDAMDFTEKIWHAIKKKNGNNIDLEISIDETTFPTSIQQHFFIINELIARKIDFVSVAPRFVGEFQKAIDYIGDIKTFEEEFAKHCELAKGYGNYKISVHSGSDKFSIFPSIGKLSSGKIHLKTAGTSWLEAVRTISIANPELYRKIHLKALEAFHEANKLYHVGAKPEKIKDLNSVSDTELPDYLDENYARQILHISYGAVLSDKNLKKEFFETLDQNEKLYIEKLEQHFTKHLAELGIKRKDA